MATETTAATKSLGVEHVSVVGGLVEFHVCLTCGVAFGIIKTVFTAARANGEGLKCPKGHGFHFPQGEPEEDRLRRHLEAERDRAARLTAERDQLEASLRGTRARAARDRKELKSVKTRVANGVCPCCGRTFKQLARHMQAKHPDYVESAPAT